MRTGRLRFSTRRAGSAAGWRSPRHGRARSGRRPADASSRPISPIRCGRRNRRRHSRPRTRSPASWAWTTTRRLWRGRSPPRGGPPANPPAPPPPRGASPSRAPTPPPAAAPRPRLRRSAGGAAPGLPASPQRVIADCAARAAAAVGLRFGPVHAELRTNERGPWLIELAARPIGGRCSGALRFQSVGARAGRAVVSLEEVVIGHALGLALPALEREPQAAGVMMIPVPGAGVLREVRRIAAARAAPLVEDVTIMAHPGEALRPWPEGGRYPGVIFARGPTTSVAPRTRPRAGLALRARPSAARTPRCPPRRLRGKRWC